MTRTHEQVEITIGYPPLKGCILKAYNLQQLLGASFGAIVELEEQVDEELNGDRLLVFDEGQPRMSLKGRTDLIVSSLWVTTSAR